MHRQRSACGLARLAKRGLVRSTLESTAACCICAGQLRALQSAYRICEQRNNMYDVLSQACRDLCVRKGWLRTSDFLSSAASARHLRVSGSRHHDIEMITIYLNDPVATSLADSGSPGAQQTRDEGVQDFTLHIVQQQQQKQAARPLTHQNSHYKSNTVNAAPCAACVR